MLAKTKFKQANIHNIFSFCNADTITELTNALRRISTTTKTADRWHSRIIPTGNIIFIYQLQELSFTRNGIIDIASCKFILMRGIDLQLFDQPIIELTMRNKLQCTN